MQLKVVFVRRSPVERERRKKSVILDPGGIAAFSRGLSEARAIPPEPPSHSEPTPEGSQRDWGPMRFILTEAISYVHPCLPSETREPRPKCLSTGTASSSVLRAANQVDAASLARGAATAYGVDPRVDG